MDLSYWEKYYKSHKHNATNSLFSIFVLENYLKCAPKSQDSLDSKSSSSSKSSALDSISADSSSTDSTNKATLLELGCGNGRDSVYFARNAINITAIDQVQSEIDYLNAHFGSKNCVFLCGDFSSLSSIASLESLKSTYDCIYSRFSLHSITHAQQKRLFAELPQYLKVGGILAIETRGKRNSLYQKGQATQDEKDAFIYEEHYRRFVSLGDLCAEIEEILKDSKSFKILYAKESQGFAPFTQGKKKEDDYFIRVIARLVDSSGGGVTKYYYIILRQPFIKDSYIIIESKADSSSIDFLDSHITIDFIVKSHNTTHLNNINTTYLHKEAV